MPVPYRTKPKQNPDRNKYGGSILHWVNWLLILVASFLYGIIYLKRS